MRILIHVDDSMMITWLTWLLVWVKLGLLDVTSPGDIPVEGGIPVLLGSPFFLG
jgi:hypothetical protein